MSITLDRICKILDVIEKDNATIKELSRLGMQIEMCINDVSRFIKKFARDENQMMDFLSGDLESLADNADKQIRRYEHNLNYRDYWKHFEGNDIVDSEVCKWSLELANKYRALTDLKRLSYTMHHYAFFLKCLEMYKEQGTIEFAFISAIRDILAEGR